MGLSGCYAIMKYIVFFLNLIFWIAGVSIMVLSIWMLSDPTTFFVSMAQDESNYYSGVYLFLAVGTLLFIIGFLGCFGALRESKVLLVLFFCLLIIVFVAEISTAAWAYSKQEQLEEIVKDTVTVTVRREYGEIAFRTETFDTIQKELKCCGANGPNDWAESKFNGADEKTGASMYINTSPKKFKVPTSCCEDPLSVVCQTEQTLAADIPDGIFADGCNKRMVEELQYIMKKSIGFGIVVAIAQLLGLIFSLVLCCAIQQRSHRYKA